MVSTLALRKAEFFPPFCSSSTVLPPHSILPFQVSPFVASDPFRHVCQLYADDLVILTASQADLQVALGAVHAWGVRWRFSFGIGPTKPPLSSLVLCAAALAAAYTSAAFPCPWSSRKGTWVLSSLPLSLGAFTSTLRGRPDCCVHLGGVPLPSSAGPLVLFSPPPFLGAHVCLLPRGSSLSPGQCLVPW